MESVRILSYFNFQWTKTLDQNNLKNIAYCFYIFQELKMLLVICNNTKKKSLMAARENECQILQNYILHMKFSELYLCFHNCCEIWLFWYKFFVHWKLKLLSFLVDSVLFIYVLFVKQNLFPRSLRTIH